MNDFTDIWNRNLLALRDIKKQEKSKRLNKRYSISLSKYNVHYVGNSGRGELPYKADYSRSAYGFRHPRAR